VVDGGGDAVGAVTVFDGLFCIIVDVVDAVVADAVAVVSAVSVVPSLCDIDSLDRRKLNSFLRSYNRKFVESAVVSDDVDDIDDADDDIFNILFRRAAIL